MSSRKVQNQTDKTEAYLEHIPLPELTNEQILSCQGIISEGKVFKSLKSIENNKSSGNGLSKEFFECFWDEIKNPFLASIHRAFLNQKLSSSQKQPAIKMLEKKTKTKDLLKTGGRYHCLNTIMKIISKVPSTRIKNVLPFLQIKRRMLKVGL